MFVFASFSFVFPHELFLCPRPPSCSFYVCVAPFLLFLAILCLAYMMLEAFSGCIVPTVLFILFVLKAGLLGLSAAGVQVWGRTVGRCLVKTKEELEFAGGVHTYPLGASVSVSPESGTLQQ